MYQVGDFLVFGTKGVCQVESVGSLDMAGMPKDKLYYTLKPYFTNGGRIYTPVDNDKVIMRPIISKEEAMELISDMDHIDSLWVMDEKKRELEYKEAMKKCDCRELLRIIKTIYFRKQSRVISGKKVTALDERYFKLAEEKLYEELAIAFQMDPSQAKEFAVSKFKQAITEG